MMEYWKEIATIIGGLLVIGRIIQMGRTVVTKTELEKHCSKQMELVKANTRVAVLEAMNEWLKANGHSLKR